MEHSDQPDPNSANDSASAETGPTSADLAVTKTVDKATPAVGDTVVFTVTVTNLGPSPTTGVELLDLLPSGYTFVSANPSQGTYTAASGQWAVGALAHPGSATLTLTATVKASGDYRNTAAVVHSDQPDPNSGNNSAVVGITVPVPIPTLSEWAMILLILMLMGMVWRSRSRFGVYH